MSKGDTPRPANKEKYDAGFEAAFGKKEIKTWNPEEKDEQEEHEATDRAGSNPERI